MYRLVKSEKKKKKNVHSIANKIKCENDGVYLMIIIEAFGNNVKHNKIQIYWWKLGIGHKAISLTF